MKYTAFALFLSVALIMNKTQAQGVTLKQIGKANILIGTDWTQTAHEVGAFYSIDQSQSINRTNLDSGFYSKVGKATYKNLKFFFTMNNRLFVIDNDGSMTQIDPVSGASSVVSSIGYWKNISNVIVVGNSFYAIENGALYHYLGFNAATRKQIGESEFYNVGTLVKFGSSLYSLTGDGNFYEISTTTGKWTKIGKSKTWKNTLTIAVVRDKFYTVENSGTLFETTISDGVKKQIDNSQFAKAQFLFEDSGKLYVASKDGTLYEVTIN